MRWCEYIFRLSPESLNDNNDIWQVFWLRPFYILPMVLVALQWHFYKTSSKSSPREGLGGRYSYGDSAGLRACSRQVHRTSLLTPQTLRRPKIAAKVRKCIKFV